MKAALRQATRDYQALLRDVSDLKEEGEARERRVAELEDDNEHLLTQLQALGKTLEGIVGSAAVPPSAKWALQAPPRAGRVRSPPDTRPVSREGGGAYGGGTNGAPGHAPSERAGGGGPAGAPVAQVPRKRAALGAGPMQAWGEEGGGGGNGLGGSLEPTLSPVSLTPRQSGGFPGSASPVRQGSVRGGSPASSYAHGDVRLAQMPGVARIGSRRGQLGA